MRLPWWYRVIAFVSGLVWLSVLWVAGCLLIVTAPAATTSLFAEARRLLAGDGVHWRSFLATGRAQFRPSLVVAAILLPGWALSVLIIAAGDVAGASFLVGVGTVATVVVAVVTTLAVHMISTGPAPIGAVFRRVGIALLLRPVVSVLMALPPLAVALLLLFGPREPIVLLGLTAGGIAAGCIETIARFPASRDATPASALKAAVLDGSRSCADVLGQIPTRRTSRGR